MAIQRTPLVDDDGTGETGTPFNNAWQTQLYDAMDAALATAGWPGGVAGNITFPAAQVPSAGANVLDDYEEGTFTPTLSFNGAAAGLTYAARSGSYVKIGQLVWVQVQVSLSAKGTSAGPAQVDGLPFIPLTGAWGAMQSPWTANAAGLSAPVQGYVFSNGAPTVYLTMNGPTGQVAITEANFSNTTDLVLVGTYRAAA